MYSRKNCLCKGKLLMGLKMKTFEQTLKELRTSRSITQKQLAQKTGISTTHISLLETGRKGPPKLSTLNRISVALNLNTEEAQTLFKQADLRRLEQTDQLHIRKTEIKLIALMFMKLGTLSSQQIKKISAVLERK